MRPDPIFEEFLQPSQRAKATVELVARGAEAIPVLITLLSGEAKNAFGVPYIRLGNPLDCALVAAGRLGALSKPLEPYIREALSSGHVYAASALGFLGTLEEATVVELAAQLAGNVILSTEAAASLVRCGQVGHPSVVKAARSSPQAAQALARAVTYLASIKA
jgi:hypothetical protein